LYSHFSLDNEAAFRSTYRPMLTHHRLGVVFCRTQPEAGPSPNMNEPVTLVVGVSNNEHSRIDLFHGFTAPVIH
jgi:hypothetical protein